MTVQTSTRSRMRISSYNSEMLAKLKGWLRRRRYREGAIVTRFVARDVRRDVRVHSAKRIEEGVISAEVRTMNVLYVSQGLQAEPEFEAARELEIEKLWDWTGASWGGLQDGTSLAERDPNKYG